MSSSATAISSPAVETLLIRKLEAMAIDPPGTELTFGGRLARDNDWTPTFAARVYAEYLRFLYLAARAGHPVTPSDEVDQAWHLHLVYTHHYWGVLCKDVLGFALHHGPTAGGESEGVKYEDWYKRTLASYEAHFGAKPPADIWPAPALRFSPGRRFVRVPMRARSSWTHRQHRAAARGSKVFWSIVLVFASTIALGMAGAASTIMPALLIGALGYLALSAQSEAVLSQTLGAEQRDDNERCASGNCGCGGGCGGGDGGCGGCGGGGGCGGCGG